MKIQERTGAGNNRSAAPAQPAMGERLPAPPRERKPALAALAVLLILLGALGATMLVLQAGDRVEVIQVKRGVTIQAGESVAKSKVTSVLVNADSDVNYVKWSDFTTLQKLKAKSTIYGGSVVVGEMFGEAASLPAGKASVGLALKEGQYPANVLKTGDTVAAYRVDDTSTGSNNNNSSGGTSTDTDTLLVDNARVDTVNSSDDATISTGNLAITVLVDQDDVPALAQAAAAGKVAVVLVPGN
ncbi:hypothetical protein [Streptomyces flaveus]|uniref:SAF domain-containing protein n=1 Tax=Streptomyces flaveus TaxID=66370 RepID=A0A917RDF0_9ACTN|nr:hypothetical protein [Streptomyces flaveus]GGL00990.1 hypothetical protein GCM10010094_72130 [Streptomyces flaveus]